MTLHPQIKPSPSGALPHRFREAQFRRYEPIIKLIVDHYPTVQQFKPNLSPETFSCRLRDAMRSFLDLKWPSDKINHHRFRELYPHIVVAQRIVGDDTLILAGGRVEIKKPPLSPPFVVEQLQHSRADLENSPNGQQGLTIASSDASPDVIRALALLHHSRILTEPTIIKTILDPEEINGLKGMFDIAIEVEKDGVRML